MANNSNTVTLDLGSASISPKDRFIKGEELHPGTGIKANEKGEFWLPITKHHPEADKLIAESTKLREQRKALSKRIDELDAKAGALDLANAMAKLKALTVQIPATYKVEVFHAFGSCGSLGIVPIDRASKKKGDGTKRGIDLA